MKFYTGPPKFEFGRVEFASGGPGGDHLSQKLMLNPAYIVGFSQNLFENSKEKCSL